MKKKIIILTLIFLSLFLISCSNEKVINELKDEHVRANVLINTTSLDGVIKANGSGVIIAKSEIRYFILTNYHVIKPDSDASFTVSVSDYYKTSYDATIYTYDKEFDLAIICIPNEIELFVVTLANDNPNSKDKVYTISNHSGETNIITQGKVEGYFSDDDYLSSEPLISHNASITVGSSGSMLINKYYYLVGINTFVITDENNNYKKSLSIPINKIKEFLDTNTNLLK